MPFKHAHTTELSRSPWLNGSELSFLDGDMGMWNESDGSGYEGWYVELHKTWLVINIPALTGSNFEIVNSIV